MGVTEAGDGLGLDNQGYNFVPDTRTSGALADGSALSGSGDTGSQLGSVNASYVASQSNVSLKQLDAASLQSSSNVVDTTSRQDLVDDAVEEYMPCKWGPVKPQCCRVFTNIKAALFVLCCASAVQGMVVNGFVNVSITSVEKRFDIESKDAGLIASAYDIASVICLLPVGYFGGNGSKPRWLGFGVLLMAIGSFVYAMPHFLTGLYEYEVRGEDEFCDTTNNGTDVCKGTQQSTLWRYKYVLYLGQLLLGVGAAPLYTLGVTYLDENLKPKMSAVYVAIFYAIAIVGPALGYIFGGYCLSLYTDFYKVNVDELSIDADSEAWVGAWWIGPLVCSALALLITVPMLGFPKRLPGWEELQKHRESEAYGGVEDTGPSSTGLKSLKDFPKALKNLLINPTFMFLNFAGAFEGILVSGIATFLPKYLESQFSLTASTAALYVGAISVPAGGGGMFLGGYLIKRFNLKVRGIIKFVIGVNVVIFLLALGFIIRCPNADFAGVNVDYSGKEITKELSGNTLKDSCNADCDCTFVNFAPVCADNDVMYFNPCAAGCLEVKERRGSDKYYNCTCVASASDGKHMDAKEGKCDTSCGLLAAFVPIIALLIFLTFATDMPALAATLRCVPEKQRSFAVSIQWIFVRCLGTIPGPVIFGAVIDETCLFWKSSCDSDTGACYFYDNKNLSNYFLALSLCCKVVSTISFTLSVLLYKAPPNTQDTAIPVGAAEPGNSPNKSSASKTSLAQSEIGAADNGTAGHFNPIPVEN